MRETIVHFWCDRCGAQYVPPQEDANTIPAILKVAPSASEATGMDLCPKCSEEYYALIEEFKSTTGNETIATPSESDIVATEPEPMVKVRIKQFSVFQRRKEQESKRCEG